jgi:protease-4
MKDFFKYLFAGLIGTFIALGIIVIIVVIAIAGITSEGDTEELKDNSILHLTFKDEISDRSSVKPKLSAFSIEKKAGLSETIKAIKNAEKDEHIKGIYLDLGMLSGGMASVEEIRTTLLDFKKSGKFIISSADYYTHKSYYLASVADSVFMTPQGEIQFTGLSAQIMMYKNLLEKIGIEPEIIRHGKFKSAVEPFMLEQISDANREQTSVFMNSLWNKILLGISLERNISVDSLKMYADNLIIRSDKAALSHKFIDGLIYKDEILDKLKTLSGIKKKDKLNLISLSDYSKIPQTKDKEFSKDKIAVIYAIGEIQSGKSKDETIGSETLSAALRKVREDSTIKAIVLRINSPGGSALASEIIWRETLLMKNKKPFIVSMGDVAASGGYYIAVNADTIVAEPNTITGSIGVFGLLFNAEGLMKTVGVNVSTVNTNSHSDIGSPLRKMDTFERSIIQKGVEDIYQTFINHVAEGRKMTVAQVDSIGQGRVWSGENAKSIGLIDVFGGLDDAILIAAGKAKLTNYRIVKYPEKDKYTEMFEKLMDDSEETAIQEKLGSAYIYYKNLESVKNINGVQARLPFFIDIK